MYRHTGGQPDADTKENFVLETLLGIRLRGEDEKKGVDVLSEGGVEVRIWRRRDAVSVI